jgi:hypothetical protein
VNVQETNNLVYGELQRQGGKGGGPPLKTDPGGQGTHQPQLNMQSVMQQSILQAAGPIWQKPLTQGFGGVNQSMVPQGMAGQMPAPFAPGVNGAITMPGYIQKAGIHQMGMPENQPGQSQQTPPNGGGQNGSG